MKKNEFLKELEQISDEFVNESWANQLYEKAEAVFEDLEDTIENFKSDLKDKEQEIESLNSDLEESQIELNRKSTHGFEVSGIHDNIVTVGVLESLFRNIEYIPIQKLEEFINQYKAK